MLFVDLVMASPVHKQSLDNDEEHDDVYRISLVMFVQ